MVALRVEGLFVAGDVARAVGFGVTLVAGADAGLLVGADLAAESAL
jgi:hypothetical protein